MKSLKRSSVLSGSFTLEETCENSCGSDASQTYSSSSTSSSEGTPDRRREEKLSREAMALTISKSKGSLLEFEHNLASNVSRISEDSNDCSFVPDCLPNVELAEDADDLFLHAIMESMSIDPVVLQRMKVRSLVSSKTLQDLHQQQQRKGSLKLKTKSLMTGSYEVEPGSEH